MLAVCAETVRCSALPVCPLVKTQVKPGHTAETGFVRLLTVWKVFVGETAIKLRLPGSVEGANSSNPACAVQILVPTLSYLSPAA